LVQHDRATLTFGQWMARATDAANCLTDLGIRKGSRVALLAGNPHLLDSAIAYIGILMCGGTVVTLCESATAHEIEQAVMSTGAKLIVGPQHVAIRLRVRQVSFEETNRASDVEFSSRADPSSTADIVFTSGTTGRHKGIVSSNWNVVVTAAAASVPSQLKTLVHGIPLHTYAGLHVGLLRCLVHGIRHRVLRAFGAAALVGAIGEERADMIYLTPTMAKLLTTLPTLEESSLRSVRLAYCFGARADPGVLAALDRILSRGVVVNVYGITEAGGAFVAMPYHPLRPESVGKPVDGTRVRVCDVDRRDLPPGKDGEIWLSSAATASRRYIAEAPAAGRDVFVGGWTRTGDLGHLDLEGYLYITGRRKEIVNMGGTNVSAVEQETVLLRHPDVVEVAVIGRPDPLLGEQAVAAVVLRQRAELASIEKYAASCFGSKLMPEFKIVGALPRNALGKVMKYELIQMLFDREQSALSD